MELLFKILFLSVAIASFSNFIDDCLQEGMILQRWGRFVEGKYWLKPLGGCLICTNAWIAILTGLGIGIVNGFGVYTLLLSILLLSLSNTALKFIIK